LSEHDPFTGPDGALIYVKTGHLATVLPTAPPVAQRSRS
jgi:hypothetical protein